MFVHRGIKTKKKIALCRNIKCYLELMFILPAPLEETRDPDECLSKFMKQNINVIIYHSS